MSETEQPKPTKAERAAADADRRKTIQEAAKNFDPPPPADLVEYFTTREIPSDLADVAFTTYATIGWLRIGERQWGNDPKEATR